MKKLLENKKAVFLLVVVVLIIIAIASGAIYINSLDQPFDKNNKDTIHVTIESGSTTVDIGQALEENGIIKSASDFKIFSKIKRYGSRYQAGAYGFSPSMTLSEIAEILISGKTSEMTFTIPEGYTIDQIARKLSDDGIVNKDRFLELVRNGNFDYDFLSSAQSGSNHLEGYLFPDTYTVPFDADEEEIIRIMLDRFDSVFTDKMKARAKKMGRSINEIMVVASIVERESKVPEERGKVASVVYNRLDIDMPLQMCSTVQYVLGEQKEVLTYADTEIQSPYNTYINPGLPPGPISCPGLSSIKAALYPEDTDYLYFVVSEKLDGTQNFSKDIEKFEKDKAAYYKALEGQN